MTGHAGVGAGFAALTLLMIAAASLTAADRRVAPARRLRSLWPPPPTVRSGSRRVAGPRGVAACGVGLAGWLLVGGSLGWICGLAAATATMRWFAHAATHDDRERLRRLALDLPGAVDLLAACLTSGCSTTAAVEEVARAVDGPVGEALLRVVAELRLGGDPPVCWQRLASQREFAPLGRALARCAESGAPIAAGMARFADEHRARRRWAAQEVARRVGIRAAAPLGLCFLPAFVLVGVVPVVVGLAGQVMRG